MPAKNKELPIEEQPDYFFWIGDGENTIGPLSEKEFNEVFLHDADPDKEENVD